MLLNTQSILAERRFAPVKAFAVAPSRIVSILAGRPSREFVAFAAVTAHLPSAGLNVRRYIVGTAVFVRRAVGLMSVGTDKLHR